MLNATDGFADVGRLLMQTLASYITLALIESRPDSLHQPMHLYQLMHL